jgi:hypothetical protein
MEMPAGDWRIAPCSPTGATLPVLATVLMTGCTCHLFVLPPHASLRYRVQGANHKHASTREPTRKASVTTAVVASPVTMRANGHTAPRLQRSLTTRHLCNYSTPKEVARQGTFRCPRSPITYRLATSAETCRRHCSCLCHPAPPGATDHTLGVHCSIRWCSECSI